MLQSLIEIDEGSYYLGEIALVSWQQSVVRRVKGSRP
nr:aminopeptidase [Oceanobacillus sp. J11TS1]